MSKCPIKGEICIKYKNYQITDLVKNKISNFNICEDCVDKLSEFDTQNSNVEKTSSQIAVNCDFCKLTLEEFIKNGRFGCSKCYDKFEKPLILILQKLQHDPDVNMQELRHVGNVPLSWKTKIAEDIDPNKFLLDLKDKLNKLIKEEKYDSAKTMQSHISKLDLLINKSNKKEISEFILKLLELEQHFKKE